MPVYDWSKVPHRVFHDFHCSWITHLKEQLNRLLPTDYYAMAEQHMGTGIGDVVTVTVNEDEESEYSVSSASGTMTLSAPKSAGIAIADHPPRVTRHLVLDDSPEIAERARRIIVRTQKDHRVVAIVEPTAAGRRLIPMPLFLEHDRYIEVPLEDSYDLAWQGVPAALRPSEIAMPSDSGQPL